jgi:peptide/nickel transport system permease protein
VRRYIVGRLLLMIPTLVGVAVITFVVMRLVPGDIVALRYAGSSVPQDIIDKERALLGLDKSMAEQFLTWMGSLAHLDFGQSLWTGNSIIDEVGTRLPLTLELAVIASAFAVAIAIPLGVVAAVKQDTWVDYSIRIFSVGGLAMPSFWIGIMLVLGTITLFGWAPPLVYTSFFDDPVANLSQMVLPAISVGYRYSAVSMRMTRSTVLDVLREDYVRTARAKGLRDTVVVIRHALRNALLPVITVVSLEFAFLIGGLVVTEQVFNLNGIGKLLVDAVAHRDYPLIQALVLLLSAVFVLVNFAVDMLYVVLDPRIRYS